MSSSFEMVASTDNTPNRLDRWLSIQVSGQNHDLSRSRVKALIEAGHATINDQTIRNASAAVKPGDHICLHIPAAEAAEPESQDIPLVVAYEDDALIVVDKPAGMVVHPAPGAPDGTLVNALLHHCGDSLSGIGGVRRPGIVHRIDKDTSGLLVVAKSDAAHHGLAAQFADHSLHRRYIAFTRGHPNPAEGRVEGNIGRHPVNRKKMAVVEQGGKHAVTHYQTQTAYWSAQGTPIAAKIICQLETGRTHQVRVHMAHKGTALIGDPLYARAARLPSKTPQALAHAVSGLGRQALHAAELGFIHPITGEFLKFSSALPYDLKHLEDLLERHGQT